MMNRDTELKLQAYLDGELPDEEAREFLTWLDTDPEARTLHAELKGIKELMAGNELPVTVPESREFYWSKIERAIRQSDSDTEVAPSPARRSPWWLRVFAPASGLACVGLLAASLLWLPRQPSSLSYLHESEAPVDGVSTISFRSESAGVTVVWIQTQAN